MSRNPIEQDNIYNEILKVCGNDPLDSAKLSQLHTIKNTVTETLRLKSVIPVNDRVFDHEIELQGYTIPPKTSIMPTLLYNQYNEEQFKDPTKFCPMRHEKKEYHPFSTLPFGAGNRSCVGKRIAEMEIQIAIYHLIKNYKIEYKGEDIKPRLRMVESPDWNENTKVFFQKRK